MAKRSVKNKSQKILTIVILCVAVIISALITYGKMPASWDDIYESAGLSQNTEATPEDFSVHFIDVGQGDCILIKSGGQSMLIDSGESGNAETVLEYIKKEQIEKLDYVVATHPHSDHIGSMSQIIKSISVDNVIMTQLPEKLVPTTKTYKTLLETIKALQLNVIKAEFGNTYQLGGASVRIISPLEDYDDLNDTSIVLRADYKNNSFIFTGDAEKRAEENILKSGVDIDADVLKLGHHGSRSSTSEDFIKKVTPKLAVISCGEDNSYGHPHIEILDLLENYKTEHKRTDKNGNIVVTSNGSELKTLTERQ